MKLYLTFKQPDVVDQALEAADITDEDEKRRMSRGMSEMVVVG